MTPVELSDAQRRSIGVLVATLRGLAGRLRELGVTSRALDELSDELRRIEAESGAIAPRTGREAQGLVSQAFVLSAEFNARAFEPYGEVTPESAAWLDECGVKLQSLAQRLLHEV